MRRFGLACACWALGMAAPVAALAQGLGLSDPQSAGGVTVTPLPNTALANDPAPTGGVILPAPSGNEAGAVLTPAPLAGAAAPEAGIVDPNDPSRILPNALPELGGVTSVTTLPTELGRGAELRLLDKTLAQVRDLSMATGDIATLERLSVELVECRYPSDTAIADAFARIRVQDEAGSTLFDGWMIASSPALVALDHPRYDVWVMRCNLS